MGSWEVAFDSGQLWPTPVANDAAKRASAAQMAKRLNEGDVVGVGSGSTVCSETVTGLRTSAIKSTIHSPLSPPKRPNGRCARN